MPEKAAITETEIRARLREEIEVIEDSRKRLAELRDEISSSLQETSEEDIDGPLDLETEIRTTLASAIQDCLNPVLDNLRAAADYQPG